MISLWVFYAFWIRFMRNKWKKQIDEYNARKERERLERLSRPEPDYIRIHRQVCEAYARQIEEHRKIFENLPKKDNEQS